MGVIGRRIATVGVLGVVVAAGFWHLHADGEARARAGEAHARQMRLFACEDLAHVVEVQLHNKTGALTLARRAQPQTPTQEAAGESHAQADAQALQRSAALGTWQLQFTGPEGSQKVQADDSTVEALLQASCALTQLGDAAVPTDDRPANEALAAFGLAPAQYTLQLRTVTGAPQILHVGHKNSFDGALFVRRGEEREVRRIDGAFLFQLERDAFSLREKRLVPLGGNAIQTLQLQVAAKAHRGEPGNVVQPFALRRTPEGFVLRAGNGNQEAEADATQAQSLLHGLAEMRAKQFVAEAPQPTDLGRYGLATPHLQATLQDDAGAATLVRFGRIFVAEQAHDFAQVGGASGPVAQLPSAWVVEKLRAGAHELRDMHVLALDAAHVAELRICATKDSGAKDNGATAPCVQFRREGPADVPLSRRAFVFDANGTTAPLPAQPADAQKLATLVGRMAELRADSFAEAPDDASLPQKAAWARAAGLDKPRLVVSFADAAGNALATLCVGSTAGRHQLVQGNKRPGVARIFAAALEGTTANPADYADPNPANENLLTK